MSENKKVSGEAFANLMMNSIIVKLQPNEKEARKAKATLEIFNKHGINTEKAFKILNEISTSHVEIESEYPG